MSRSPGRALERIFQGQLQKARIRRVVLEKLAAGDLPTLRPDALVGGIAPRRMDQQIEGVRTELQ